MVTIDFSTIYNSGFYWYYYKLPDGNKIPIYIFEVPFKSNEIKDDGLKIENVIVENLPMPIWSYKGTSNYQAYAYIPESLPDDLVCKPYNHDGYIFYGGDSYTSAPYFYNNKISPTKLLAGGRVYIPKQNGYELDNAFILRFFLAHTTDDFYYQLPIATGAGDSVRASNLSNLTIPTEHKKGYGGLTGRLVRNSSSVGSQYIKEVTTIAKYIIGESTFFDDKDPNQGGGSSQGGGGGGDDNIGGDTNPDDGLPDISALDSGLLTAYNPNVDELQALGRFLWSDSFDVNTFKKLFNDPFDTLLGLSIVPVAPKTSGSKNIMFGNLDSGVSAAVVSNQWVLMDMGTLHLNEVWKGALDYAPSTGVCIYLPFIGMRQLNVNDIMGSSLHLIYKFDVLTGSVIAQIYVNHDNRGNPSQGFSYTKNMGLCYEFIGQCGENIPLASQDFTNTIRAAISGVAVASGAAASIATGNPALGIASLTVGAANAGMQANTPNVERGGHLSGSASIMGYSQPFLIVERPHQCKPSRYYSLRGIPSQVYTSKLANCTGFTQITDNNNIHASGAQDAELEEIERLLTSGVYFPDKKRS